MYTLGADPELFIIDTTTGNCVSSHNLIEGTKENPFKVMCGATQVDGVSAEFNIDPCENSGQFVNKIYTVTDALPSILIIRLDAFFVVIAVCRTSLRI